MKTIIIALKKQKQLKLVQLGNCEQTTVIQSINATEQAILFYIIFKERYYLSIQYKENTIPQNQLILVSQNSQTTNKISLQQLEHFNTYTEKRTIKQYQLLIVTRCYEHVFIRLLEALIVTTYNIQCNTRRCVREQQQNVYAVRKYRQSLYRQRLGSSQLINRFQVLAKHPAFVCAFRCQGNHGSYRDTYY